MTTQTVLVLASVLVLVADSRVGASIQASRTTFVGTTPCGDVVRAFVGGIAADTRCHAIKWELLLGTAEGANRWSLTAVYGVPAAANPNAMVDGPRVTKQGTLATAAMRRSGATSLLFRLILSDSARSIAFAQIGADLVNLATDDGSLSAGTSGWSYTLTRADRVESPVVEVSRGSEGSSTVAPRESGPHVFGIFEGRSPCAGLARDLKLEDAAGCVRAKWRVTLLKDPSTSQPTTYKVEGSLIRTRPWTGAWRIGRGAPGFPDASVYQLDGEASHGPIVLLRADENLVLFLNQQRQLLPGTADFSYTLTRSVR